MRSRTDFGHRQNATGSISASTGDAPTSRTAFAVAPNVKPGMITSSPGPIPSAAKQVIRAEVPELTATQGRPPTISPNSCSNPSTSWPPVSMPEDRAEAAAAISASARDGCEIGINHPPLRVPPLPHGTHCRLPGSATGRLLRRPADDLPPQPIPLSWPECR